MGKTWKAFERQVGDMFGVKRNPLSGTNNRNDDGTKRLGDVLYRPAIIELKLRKRNATIKRAQETKKLAKENNKPFLHVERVKGDRKTLALCVDSSMAEKLIKEFMRIVENRDKVCCSEEKVCQCQLPDSDSS